MAPGLRTTSRDALDAAVGRAIAEATIDNSRARGIVRRSAGAHPASKRIEAARLSRLAVSRSAVRCPPSAKVARPTLSHHPVSITVLSEVRGPRLYVRRDDRRECLLGNDPCERFDAYSVFGAADTAVHAVYCDARRPCVSAVARTEQGAATASRISRRDRGREHFDIYFTPGDQRGGRWRGAQWSSGGTAALADASSPIARSATADPAASHPNSNRPTSFRTWSTKQPADSPSRSDGESCCPWPARWLTPTVIGTSSCTCFRWRCRGRRGQRAMKPAAALVRRRDGRGYLARAADASTAMWCAMPRGVTRCLRSDDLDNPAYFPYRWGHAFWARCVAGRWGDGASFGGCSSPLPNPACARPPGVLGRSTTALTQEWHAAIRQAYAPVLEVTSTRAVGARVAFGGASSRGDLNVGPAISPDGRVIAFLSGRGTLLGPICIADAQSGRILRLG